MRIRKPEWRIEGNTQQSILDYTSYKERKKNVKPMRHLWRFQAETQLTPWDQEDFTLLLQREVLILMVRSKGLCMWWDKREKMDWEEHNEYNKNKLNWGNGIKTLNYDPSTKIKFKWHRWHSRTWIH